MCGFKKKISLRVNLNLLPLKSQPHSGGETRLTSRDVDYCVLDQTVQGQMISAFSLWQSHTLKYLTTSICVIVIRFHHRNSLDSCERPTPRPLLAFQQSDPAKNDMQMVQNKIVCVCVFACCIMSMFSMH